MGSLLLTAWIGLGFHYSLPADYMLQQYLKQRSVVRSMTWSQKTTMYDDSFAGGKQKIREDFELLVPVGYRRVSRYPSGRILRVSNGTEAIEVVGGEWRHTRATQLFEMPLGMYLQTDLNQLKSYLMRIGINPDARHVTRMGKVPVYALGSAVEGGHEALLWMDKEAFVPIGMTWNRKDQDKMLQLKWNQLPISKQNGLYPRQIEVYRGEKLIQKIEVTRPQLNRALKAERFDIARIKQSLNQSFQDRRDLFKGSTSSTDRLIDDFRSRYLSNE